MCIICVKPMGIELPPEDAFRASFSANSDGAGFAYAKEGKVHAIKGLMTIDAFLSALASEMETIDALGTSMIFHFRIGTHGSKNFSGHTHPFPILSEYPPMIETHFSADRVLFHNGILSAGKLAGGHRSYTAADSGPSDTMELVANVLAPLYSLSPDALVRPDIRAIVSHIIGTNKLAVLDGSGNIELFGEFFAEGGLSYSNKTYIPIDDKPQGKSKYQYSSSWWGDEDNRDKENRKLLNYKNNDPFDLYDRYMAAYKNAAQCRERAIARAWKNRKSGYDRVLDEKMLTFYTPYDVTLHGYINESTTQYRKEHALHILAPWAPWYMDKDYATLYFLSLSTGELIDSGNIEECYPLMPEYIKHSIIGWPGKDFRLWSKRDSKMNQEIRYEL